MRKAILLYNKQAGRGRVEYNLDSVLTLFADAGYSIEPCHIEFGKNPFDGYENIDLVVVAGGDGTLNYVVNAMMHKRLRIDIGVLPAGTANDFAGAIGMDRDIVKAARQIIQSPVEEIDCGRVEHMEHHNDVDDIYFVNIFSFGIFTTTSQHTPERLKHRVGRFAYVLEGLRELKDVHGIPLTITTDDEAFYYPTLMGLVLNGETAGRVPLARKSSLRDGLFDCLFLKHRKLHFLSVIDMLLYLVGIRTGAVRFLRTSELMLVTPISEATDVDGQHGGKFPLRLSCIRGALRVRCPL